jgi:hypothetical protein
MPDSEPSIDTRPQSVDQGALLAIASVADRTSGDSAEPSPRCLCPGRGPPDGRIVGAAPTIANLISDCRAQR